MPIDGGLSPATFNLRVVQRLDALQAQATDEGFAIAPGVYARALLYALMAPPADDGTLTICATPQDTLILRWFDKAGAQITAREVGKEGVCGGAGTRKK